MNSIPTYLSKLISFRTVTVVNNPEVTALYDFVEQETQHHLYKYERIESGGFTSLIIDTSDQKPEIILSAHIDVVPGSEQVFTLQETATQLIGRGVIDMKFATACYIQLLKDRPEVLSQKKVRIILTADEEIGGKHGVGYLAEQGYFDSKIVILPDGGTGFSLMKAEKGVVHCTITKHGQAAHGAYPWRGTNALELLVEQVRTFQSLFEVSTSEHSWKSTATLTMAQSGKAINQIPDLAKVSLDVRFTEEYNLEQMKQMLSDHFVDCEIEIFSEGECVFLSDENPLVQSFLKIVSKHIGGPVNMVYEHGASDARYLSPRNIPVIMTKPLSGGEHTEAEWIDKNSLETFYQILEEYLTSS